MLLEWVLALEVLALAILAVMLAIGFILGRLQDKDDRIAAFVNTFWHELLWPPVVMAIDSSQMVARPPDPGVSGLGLDTDAPEPSEADAFYGRVPKTRDGRTAKADLIVLVIPNAASDAVLGRDGDGMRIQVTGEAGESRANKALIEIVAGAVHVKPFQITLTKGHYQARKTVQIQGLSPQDLQAKLATLGDAE